jgi:predicted ATPase/class 3 adenylate cyclase
MDTVDGGASEARRALPSGTVTFLFTDIEGSTVRWDRDPKAMQGALRKHDEVMREAIEASGGVVFKTVGDAFYAVFAEPSDAVAGALESQRRLRAVDFTEVDGLRVRVSLHTGTADERDGDYFGPTLNRVARLLSIGHGGQILLSGAIVQLVGERLPEGSSLRDMGEHRLKDLTAAEHVYQLLAPDLDAEFPKLKSLSVLDNNLPQQLTGLIGRQADVAAIKELALESPLVTLIGAGGIGKTRTALQVAAELLESFADGVWFVDLAPLQDPALVGTTIGTVFELQEPGGGRTMLDSLVSYLKPKKLLLVLDNCEHVIEAASTTVAALLRACDGVKILATSREHLSVQGEKLYRMPSLGVPEPSTTLTAAEALEYGAVDLFVARAAMANGRFALTNENASVVAEICRQLDGIPLAIELAAARVRILAPKQLAEKLGERFRLLTGGDRTALPRQQTMRAAIDWSYDLLSAEDQRVFRMLSVFAGSFSLETAAAVCAASGLDEFDVFAIVASLADKSLIHAEHGDELFRYRLLESTRQYGAEKLAESGDFEAVAELHAATYANVAEAIVVDYDTAPHGHWVALAEAELENVRAALTWSFERGTDPSVALRLAATLHRTMALFNAREAQRWLTGAVERCDDATEATIVGRLALAQAFLSNVFNQFAAVYANAQKAIACLDLSDNPRARADAQRMAGRALIYLDRAAEGEALLETSLAAHRRLGSRGTGAALRDLAIARASAGDLDRSRHLFAEALRDFEHREDLGNVAQTVGTLAGVEFQAGNVEAALGYAAQALEALRKLKRRLSIAWILGEMATFSIAGESFDDALGQARESLAVATDLPSALFTVHALRQIAIVAALRPHADERGRVEDLERAARIVGFVDVRLAELETTLEPAEQRQSDAARARLREDLGEERFEHFRIEGSHLTEDRAIATALTVRELRAILAA